MNLMHSNVHARTTQRLRALALVAVAATVSLAMPASLAGQTKKTAPAPKPAAAAAKPAASTAGKPGTASTASKPGTASTASKPGSPAAHTAGTTGGGTGKTNTTTAMKPGTSVRTPGGGSKTMTAKGAEVTKSPTGRVESVKTANGNTAKFASNGHVKEVRDPARNMTVSRGPGGMRRTEVERPDHSRLVADGHGRGYIQRPYVYGGHPYYSRAYYYNGGYYNAYYRGYYYNGVYLNGYMPAYYYPPVYYGWAYNPWPAPVAYSWGWGGNPWYGYYGAYFAPYPVYPSASYWLADYLVAASLRNAYASLSVTARLNGPNGPNGAPHLVYASYDPATGTTSPTMTKEVKDAIAEEIKDELALQKTQGTGDSTPASLKTLLDDGKPHVFVASSGLTVTSAGQDCGLTDGDVLSLPSKPAADAANADLNVLASKQADCQKGSTVSVPMTDLQEMQNHLMASIDQGMAQMKDHPGQGGLPAPPADAVAGTKQAPYATAAPAADPNGAAELDQQAKQGAEVEQQVVAEADAADGSSATAETTAPAATGAGTSGAAHHSGPVAIALGQTPAQVIEMKGQPTNKVNFPNKQIYIYPDMKITFVNGKLTDAQ